MPVLPMRCGLCGISSLRRHCRTRGCLWIVCGECRATATHVDETEWRRVPAPKADPSKER